MIKDYYELMQVHPKASADIIKKAYQTLAKKYHPDLSKLPPEEASRHMSELNEAYRILSDPQARAQYDEARLREEQQAKAQVRELSREQDMPSREMSRRERYHIKNETAYGEHDPAGSNTIRFVLAAVIVLILSFLAGFFYFSSGDSEPEDKVHYKSLQGNPSVKERKQEIPKPKASPTPSYDSSNDDKLRSGNTAPSVGDGPAEGKNHVEVDGRGEVRPDPSTQESHPETGPAVPSAEQAPGDGQPQIGEQL